MDEKLGLNGDFSSSLDRLIADCRERGRNDLVGALISIKLKLERVEAGEYPPDVVYKAWVKLPRMPVDLLYSAEKIRVLLQREIGGI